MRIFGVQLLIFMNIFVAATDLPTPMLSPDGEKIFFFSHRPLTEGLEPVYSIWVAVRDDGGWSPPRPLSATINSGGANLRYGVAQNRSGTGCPWKAFRKTLR